MLIGAKTSTRSSGGKVLDPTLLNWLQSDGSGYVDTGFHIESPYTELQISASFTSEQSYKKPLVCSGTYKGIEGHDTTNNAFGFAATFADRLIYFRTSIKGWWSPPYAAQWKDGNMHDISICATSAYSCSASLDGASITMQQNVTNSFGGTPDDTQVIFGSKFNGEYCLVNDVYKVRRVAYALDDVLLADFRAAEVDAEYGFYDLVSNTFRPATGTLISGGAQTS